MSRPFRVPSGCSEVLEYGFALHGVAGYFWVKALDYWPLFPGLKREGGTTYIAINPNYGHWAEPAVEKLANGEVRPMPTCKRTKGRPYYNRSRRARS